MDVPLTRRGWAVAGLTVGCWLLAGTFGPRSLNAVVVPGVAVLAAALWIVRAADPPDVDRRLPEDGSPGDSGVVELEIDGDRAGVYTVRDAVPTGLSASPREHEIPGTDATVEYELGYQRRGAYELGPVDVELTDVLGLARREFSVGAGRDRLLVFPELVTPPASVRSSLEAVLDREPRRGRDEFDRLREYDRGDALRDVHWKSSAKRPDDELVVKEFERTAPDRAVRIAAGTRGSLPAVDAVATAAASVTLHLLEEGVEVGLRTPDETVEPGQGLTQRRSVLSALARLTSGQLRDDGDAQILVTASDRTAVLEVAGQSIAFDDAEQSEVIA